MPDEFNRAGLLLRVISKVIDFIIIATAAQILPKVGYFAGLLYLLIGDGFFEGRSVGKRLVGLRVISANTDKPCTFKESILRNSVFGIGFLFYKIPWIGWIFITIVLVVEFIILLGSRDGMRLGDEIAKTKVVALNTETETVTRNFDAQ
jgi:uncharacterized RDD family membrane protein YckC